MSATLLHRRRLTPQEIILDSVPAMIWFKDASNRIVRCNRAAARWYGRDRAFIEGRTAYELFPDRAHEYHSDDLAVIRSGKPIRGLIEQVTSPRGQRCWIQRDLIPYEGPDGQVAGVIIFAVDVTEIKRAEALMREHERQKEFLANVSHELRTPIAAIKGFAETLRSGGLEDKEHRGRFVRIIERHAERLGGLVEDLLTLSALDNGTQVGREPIALAAFVENHVEGLAPVFRKKRLRLVLKTKPVNVKASTAFLRQLLDNLLSNAIKFTKPGRRVWVEARPSRGMALLCVRDEGLGIAPEHQERIFDRFFRVEPGNHGRGHSGLGLHIVKRVVDAHGGKVWVESRLGEGSTFFVLLPRD